jgi:hypothetical protein
MKTILILYVLWDAVNENFPVHLHLHFRQQRLPLLLLPHQRLPLQPGRLDAGGQVRQFLADNLGPLVPPQPVLGRGLIPIV